MAEASAETLRSLLGGVSHVADDRLNKALASAKRKVINDGISVSHECFSDMQEYYAAHLLESGGAIDRAVASRSVGDVSSSFATQGKILTWLDLYRAVLVSIQGITGRIA